MRRSARWREGIHNMDAIAYVDSSVNITYMEAERLKEWIVHNWASV